MKGNIVKLSEMNIGFNSDVKVLERNEFEITGDITAKLNIGFSGVDEVQTKQINIERLYVVYNHDGLLEHVYNNEPVPDNILLFKDVETHVNGLPRNIEWNYEAHDGMTMAEKEFEETRLNTDKGIEVFGDFSFIILE